MDVIKSNDILKEKRRNTMLKINMLSSFYNISEEKGITSSARNLNILIIINPKLKGH